LNQGRTEMITLDPTYGLQIYQRFPAAVEYSSEITDSQSPTSDDKANRQQDTVSLSNQGKKLSAENSVDLENNGGITSENNQESYIQKTQEQVQHDFEVVQQLKKRDREVRTHEQAHLSVAGRYAAGGASFSYQTGPDGTRYATGGEVPIDLSAENTPEATIQKMETIKRAALAPADPSSADRQIAAEASAKEIQAMQEFQNLQREKANPDIASADSGISAGQSIIDNPNAISPSLPETSPISSNQILIGSGQRMMINAYQGIASLA
jgi:hypothetical protein